MKLENLTLKRITVHKIFGKSKTNPEPYAGDCTEFIKLGIDGMEILHARIESCLNHKSKFYELDVEDKGDESFFNLQKPLYGARSKGFLNISQKIADKAASAHNTANIPNGLILLVEATISGLNTIIVVKAEMSNAFSLTGNDLQLIKDIFLSSDKTLYKLGFCIHKNSNSSSASGYRFYVYDDAFSPSKDDLAHYFYSGFLGLTTERNQKLLTNNFHKALTNFIKDHVEIGDTFDLIRTIDRAFLDSKRKLINAEDFKQFFPDDLELLYETQIQNEFPNSFVKDNSIINSIETKRIALTSETTLLLRNAPDGIITGSTWNEYDKEKLQVTIDSGGLYNYALIPIATIQDTTKYIKTPPKKR